MRCFKALRSCLSRSLLRGFADRLTQSTAEAEDVSIMELFHDQLPLAVPCYNLLPVTELTVGRDERGRRAFPAPLS